MASDPVTSAFRAQKAAMRPRETYGNPDLRDRGQGGRDGISPVGVGVGERAGDPRIVMHELNLDGYNGPPDGPVLPRETYGNPDLRGNGQGGRSEQAFDINQYGPQNPPSLEQFLTYMEGAANAGTVSAADIARAKMWFGSQPGILEAVKQAAVGLPVDWAAYKPIPLGDPNHGNPHVNPADAADSRAVRDSFNTDGQKPIGESLPHPQETLGNPDLHNRGQGSRGASPTLGSVLQQQQTSWPSATPKPPGAGSWPATAPVRPPDGYRKFTNLIGKRARPQHSAAQPSGSSNPFA